MADVGSDYAERRYRDGDTKDEGDSVTKRPFGHLSLHPATCARRRRVERQAAGIHARDQAAAERQRQGGKGAR